MRVKWVRVRMGSDEPLEARCHLLAQELGAGQRLDEVFGGPPSLTVVKLLLWVAADQHLPCFWASSAPFSMGRCEGTSILNFRVKFHGLGAAEGDWVNLGHVLDKGLGSDFAGGDGCAWACAGELHPFMCGRQGLKITVCM